MALDFSLSEDQKLIRRTAEQIVERFAPRKKEFTKLIREEHKFPEEVWRAQAEAGLMGAVIPEEYGGNNMGLLALAIATEAMGGTGLVSGLLILTAMDSACIVRNGSEELKKRILPRVAEGKLKMCFAITEAQAGTNSFRMTTHARKSADGSHYLVSGEKTYITGADDADLMLLVVRTTTLAECKERGVPRTFGLSLLLMDPHAPGVTLTPLNTRGIEAHRQFTVHMEDVRVPAENLVGEQDGGAIAMFTSLNPERILAAAIACGMTNHLLQRSVEYAKQRTVFGDRPIGAYQAVAHPLADIHMELESVRHLVQRAAWAFDRNDDPAEVGFWSTAAKYKSAEMAIAAADRAIQTHGGSGFDADVGIIHYWDAARLLRTAPINREMILNYVSEHRLGLPRSY